MGEVGRISDRVDIIHYGRSAEITQTLASEVFSHARLYLAEPAD